MTTLTIDRSTEVQSLALEIDGSLARDAVLEGADSRSGDWVRRVEEFLGGVRPDRIVAGTGPGSFAGIRAALAFAQGWALGSECKVFGLPSACAFALPDGPSAVVGDARRGSYWVALFDGPKLALPVFLADAETLPKRVPLSAPVFSPDAKRIGSFLEETFGERWRKEPSAPLASGLAKAYLANPDLLVKEPLPIYLNPAVRTS